MTHHGSSMTTENMTTQYSPRRMIGLLRKLLKEYVAVRPYLIGDFDPLMPYSLAQDTWIEWQFDLPEKGEGMVQAFRRGQSIYEVARFRLRGLDPGAGYVFTNLDSGQSQTLTGYRAKKHDRSAFNMR